MKPLIGITAHYLMIDGMQRANVGRDYYEAVAAAGGMPVLLPPLCDTEVLARLDGLLFSGGPDIDPLLFGETPHRILFYAPERDASELALYHEAVRRNMPILGICRGMQLINVAAGGTLWQDIPSQCQNAHGHDQNAPRDFASHMVKTSKGRLREWLGDEARTNSFHHQAVKQLAPGFQVTACALDGLVEGIEAERGFIIGVQFHCENLWRKDKGMLRIFEGFIQAAGGCE